MELICKKCLLREMAQADQAMIKKYTEAMHCFVKAMHMIPHKIKPLYFMMELYYDQKDYKLSLIHI